MFGNMSGRIKPVHLHDAKELCRFADALHSTAGNKARLGLRGFYVVSLFQVLA